MQNALSLVQQLEQVLQDASTSPDTQMAKYNLRARLNSITAALPAAPPNRLNVGRSASEAPSPAQPSVPRSPPPLKLSRTATKTKRCAERAQSILSSAHSNPDVLGPADFFQLLFSSVHGKMGKQAEQEEGAMSRLWVGYDSSTPQLWREARGPVDLNSISIQKFLKEEVDCASVTDLETRLVQRHRNLAFQDGAQDISTFIRNLLQTVNAIKFSMEMTELGAGKGGTGRKTAVYKAMHISEQSADTYKVWKRATKDKVRARNKLCKVYLAFGPVMFLDPFWHPRNLQPNHRTPDFGETLDELIKSISSNPANGSLLGERISSNCLALSTALDLFWPAASDYVMSFCKEHPPNISVENSDYLDSDL